MDVIQENVNVEDSKWKTPIPLMIDSWVEKKTLRLVDMTCYIRQKYLNTISN